ncbi:FAD:protein FMN transferase [Isoptericola sp. NPDC055881]
METVMGVPVSLVLRAPDDARSRAAVRAAFDRLHAADARFSPYRQDSELCRYARGQVPVPSGELREVLDLAEAARRASGGAFDVRRPDDTLDTNGVVKGWAAQRTADQLRADGFHDLCLNAGGDVVAAGSAEHGRPWVVGVRSPFRRDALLARVEVVDGAVATSGTYERGAHVWDGRTGCPAESLVAATVVAGDLTTADVLATSVLALGPDGVSWAAGQGASLVLAVRPDLEVISAGVAAPAAAAR